jgi:hypothetical protein
MIRWHRYQIKCQTYWPEIFDSTGVFHKKIHSMAGIRHVYNPRIFLLDHLSRHPSISCIIWADAGEAWSRQCSWHFGRSPLSNRGSTKFKLSSYLPALLLLFSSQLRPVNVAWIIDLNLFRVSGMIYNIFGVFDKFLTPSNCLRVFDMSKTC